VFGGVVKGATDTVLVVTLTPLPLVVGTPLSSQIWREELVLVLEQRAGRQDATSDIS
jgi:hypothetical protein